VGSFITRAFCPVRHCPEGEGGSPSPRVSVLTGQNARVIKLPTALSTRAAVQFFPLSSHLIFRCPVVQFWNVWFRAWWTNFKKLLRAPRRVITSFSFLVLQLAMLLFVQIMCCRSFCWSFLVIHCVDRPLLSILHPAALLVFLLRCAQFECTICFFCDFATDCGFVWCNWRCTN